MYFIISIYVSDNIISTVTEINVTEQKRLLQLEIEETIFIREKVQILSTFDILLIILQIIEKNAQ